MEKARDKMEIMRPEKGACGGCVGVVDIKQLKEKKDATTEVYASDNTQSWMACDNGDE